MTSIRRPLALLAASAPLWIPACGDDGGQATVGAGEASTPTTVPTAPAETTEDAPTVASESTSASTTSATTAQALTDTGADTLETTATTGPGDGSTSTSTSATSDGPGVPHCSDDLHDVLDGDGVSTMTCANDQACLDAACQPVCDVVAALAGTVGCEFWAPTPPFTNNGLGSALDGPCFAVFLANAWSGPAAITVTYGGQPLDVTKYAKIPKSNGAATIYEPLPPEGLPADEVAILFLSHKPGTNNINSLECPVPPAILADTAVPGTGLGEAFHVVSDVPVSAYDINPYGGALTYLPSAALLLPATSWGLNHMAIGPAPNEGAMFALVIAREDDTTIKVAPTATLPGGGGQSQATADVTTEYVLDAGQTLQWAGTPFDASGSVFASDKPIGLWTGNTYMYVTSATLGPGGGDSAHQQIVPVKAMGHEYVGAGVVTRLASLAPESVPYRMVGAVADTDLAWDPAPPPGAPVTLSAGQVVQFETTILFTVRSQDSEHPFLFSQYMSGTGAGTRPGCTDEVGCQLGDEEWISLLSATQFQRRYVFFTDPTYPTTNLVITRARHGGEFADVDVACLGTVTDWSPVGSAGIYQVAHVDLERSNVPVADCGTSRHLAESDGPFGIVVWGTDYASSYAYPAGSDISKINEVTLPVPG